MNIRRYKDTDYSAISLWWNLRGLQAPGSDMLPEDTFIIEEDNTPLYSACLYYLDKTDIGMVEHVVSNPLASKELKNGSLLKLFQYLEQLAKEKNIKKLVIFSYEDKVKQVYSNLGFNKTLDNVTTFCKEIA